MWLLLIACLAFIATAQEEAEEPAAVLCNATFTSDADCNETSGGHAAMVLKPDSATVCT
eukprot:COSAG04_NODE_15865_length_518_cov_0.653938_1_plen_59_part_00